MVETAVEPQGDLLTADNPDTATTQTTDWKESVPKEVRFNEDGLDRLSKFNEPHEVAKSYLELENSMGAKVKIPDENTPPEEVSAFFQRLGRPTNPEGYSVPEDGKFSEPVVKAVQQAAFDAGVSLKQWESQIKTLQMAQEAEGHRIQEETERTLREKWGANYDTNIRVAGRAVSEYNNEDFTTWQKETGVGNHRPFIEFCQWVASKVLDDTLVRGQQVKEDEFVPANINSPEMYATGDDEYSVKARAYFERRGHKY